MNVAVFGSNGFIGRALVRFCDGLGHNVSCFGHDKLSSSACCKQFFCDLADSTSRIEIPKNTKAVFYLAQARHYRDFPKCADELFAINALGAARAARAAKEAGCCFFCFASTGSVYAPSFEPLSEISEISHGSPYATSKLMGEMAAMCFDGEMKILNARIFSVYGPGQRNMLPFILASRIIRHQAIDLAPSAIKNDCDGLRLSFIYVDDLVRRLLCLAEIACSGGELPKILNIGGKSAVSLRCFGELLGKQLKIKPIFNNSSAPRTGDLVADISRLESCCPLPFTPLEEGIEITCRQLIVE